MHNARETQRLQRRGLTEEFYLTNDGIRLHAKLDRPSSGPSPLAIVLHALAGHMEEEHIVAVREFVQSL